MPFFRLDGQRLAYTEFGGGPAAVGPGGVRGRTAHSSGSSPRAVILLHGLLLSQRMHRPLAEALAARGNRVITLDLLGHGRSDRPEDMWRYSMSTYGDQVVALMDHLELDQAVVMGTSLGANVALEVASRNPGRLRGLVIEMPVLDNALLWSALAFTPLLFALTVGEPVMRVLSRVTSAVPRRFLPHYGNVMLDVVRQEPGPSGAILQGLFFGRIAPPRSERREFEVPALVLGHPRDPVHPFSDADMLVRELARGRLVRAESIVELRLQPERLTEEIGAFIEEAWTGAPGAGARSSRSGARTGSRGASGSSASTRARGRTAKRARPKSQAKSS